MSAIELIESPWNGDGQVFAGVTLRGVSAEKRGYAGLNFADHVGDKTDRVARHRALLASQLENELSSAPCTRHSVGDAANREGANDAKPAGGNQLAWHWQTQVHGIAVNEILTPSQASMSPCPKADAALTNVPQQVCCILTADCLPVFFYNPTTSQVALAHAGWRGLADGVLEATVEAMGGLPSAIEVWFGPAIGPCHFEVGAEVRERFSAATDSTESLQAIHAAFNPRDNSGKFMADIYGLAEVRLKALGISAISGAGLCTYCEPESGRCLSLIFIK